MFELVTILVTISEVVKRFIPKKARKIVVPALNLAGGVGLSWAGGGHEAGLDAVVEGLTAGAAAIGTYKGSKEVGGLIVKPTK